MSRRTVVIPIKKSRGAGTNAVAAQGVYGNTTAARFLRDLMAGTDSLDVVVLGDSNAGSPGSAGYSAGWHRVMEFGLGVQPYATCMMNGGAYLATQPTTGNNRADGLFGLGTGQAWPGHNDAVRVAGSTGGPQSLLQTSDPALVDLRDDLGYNFTNYTNEGTTMVLKPQGWQWDPVGVGVDVTYSSQAHTNYLTVTAGYNQYYNNWGSSLVFGTSGTGGNTLQYRVVFPQWGDYTDGSFRLKCSWLPGVTQVALGPVISTNSSKGVIEYVTETLEVNGSAINDFESSGKKRLAFSWDGFGNISHAAFGPVAVLWQSVIRPNTKGYAVSCLTYHGGLTTDQLATRIETSGKCLDTYLKELRTRQIAGGGSGRVLVFVNSGVNDWNAYTDWNANMQRIKTHFSSRWQAMGGNATQLCFVLTPTHPTTSVISPNPWPANRAAVVSSANTWATANAGDGMNACVVDIGAGYSAVKMEKYLMYGTGAGDVAHLSPENYPSLSGTTRVAVHNDLCNAYTMVTQSMVSRLLATA
jgi:hypothetical protein